MERIFYYTAASEGDDIKTILKQHFKMSTSLIKQLKNTPDGILVNGEHQNVNFILSCGDKLQLTLRDTASPFIVPTPMELDIVYEDEDIMIVNKPAGIPTHPSQGHFTGTLANGVMYYFKDMDFTFRAVNRLDKDTSGLMCIAKNCYSHARLCETLHRDFVRKYTAIVIGQITDGDTVSAPIERCDASVIKRCVSDTGQYAVTHYTPIKTFADYSLIELSLETGRTHQIRVHMSHIGHPLLGDWLYGAEDKSLFLRTALHSSYIKLAHPVTNRIMEFSLPLAADMAEFLAYIKE